MKNVVKILVEKKTVVVTTLGRSGCGYEDNIKLDLRGRECEGVDYIEVAQEKVHQHDIEKTK
jgi:hypothetical protein